MDHALGVDFVRHRTRLIVARTTLTLLERLLADHQVGIDMCLDTARRVHAGRVDFKPALGCLSADKRRAPNIRDLMNGFFGGQSVRDFDHCALGVAVQQQVALTVDNDGAAHLV